MSMTGPAFKRVAKKSRYGFRGHPIGTVAFYGPTNELASKVVLGISKGPDDEAIVLGRWFSEGADIRTDDFVGTAILDLLRVHTVRSVVMTRGIIGCPHEEGVDYPAGGFCPRCPFWKDRDRWRET